MSQDQTRNALRAMTAEQHFAHFQEKGQPLREALQAGFSSRHAFRQCSQEAVNDLKALLYWQEFTADNIPPLATDVRDYEFFLYEMYEEALGEQAPGGNYITIVSKETGCYTPTSVAQVDYSAGYHKATPTLAAMQNITKEPCGNTRVKLPT